MTSSQARLFGSLCLMTGSRHEAEDIAQEAYVRVLEPWDEVQRLDRSDRLPIRHRGERLSKAPASSGNRPAEVDRYGAEPGCIRRGGGSSGHFHSNGSDEIGRGPYSGSSIHFTVRDGKISRASMYREFGKYASQMWHPFEEWVSTNYPADVAEMYEETSTGDYALTAESIRSGNNTSASI
jgi:hypothetical protein